ncbi:MAG: ATPase [Bacillaceae bacterium]|nr:MAG: ATPase [Bacillaceae bacterium]BBU38901.1 hypothetical protein APP_11930 [Aeribacillus pallidus]
MPGAVFRQAVQDATGITWEEWVTTLKQAVDSSWSHEHMKEHICEQFQVSDEWGEWLTVMYGQLLGRIPVGVTKDAGVQIGVRKTIKVEQEKVWDYLTSPQGLPLWIGDVSEFRLQKGYEFKSKEGICGKLTVVLPFRKLRMKWKLPEWEKPSRLQLYLLPTDSGKTTIAIHQEMLDDVYVRELMRRFWADKLEQIKNYLEGRNE